MSAAVSAVTPRRVTRSLPKRAAFAARLVASLLVLGVGGLLGSPSQAAAQWTEPVGQGWTSLTGYHQSTSEVFSPTGDQLAYPLEGEATATQFFITTAIGLGPAFDAWVQFAFQSVEFSDLTAVRRSTGLGDVRIYGRWSPSARLGWSLPVALRAGVKLPFGDFDAFSSVLPLGDGQTDFEFIAEVGHSFWPTNAYVTAWFGYRVRRAQPTTGFEVGNEPFFLLSGARSWDRLGARIAVDGILGQEPAPAGLGGTSQARRLIRLAPALTLDVGPGGLELGARFPVVGRNLPAAPDLVVGYFVRWGGGA